MSNLFKLFLFFIKHRDSVIRSLNISADVILGSGCSLHRGVTILSGTRIGRGVKLYRDVYCGKNTIIGDYSSINRYSIVDCGSIGNFSSIGPNCLIGAGKHAIKYISTSQRVYGKNNILGISTPFEAFDSPPIIGHDVWIGNNVTVMQGVKIGNGAVIGSGAVVTKDIPPYTIMWGSTCEIYQIPF